MRAYITSRGVRHRKVSSIPATANIEAQTKFHDEQFQPRLEEAKAGKRVVVLGAFLGYLWRFVRVL